MLRHLPLTLLAAGLLLALPSDSHALSKRAAISAARNEKRDAERFKRLFARLKASDQASVINSLDKSNFTDSDGDGVPDLVEHSKGLDSCKSDSDDDGHSDGDEREARGAISAVSGSSITLSGLVFNIDGSTSFEGLVQGDLAVGVCVKAEGVAAEDGSITAVEISSSDSCTGHGHHD